MRVAVFGGLVLFALAVLIPQCLVEGTLVDTPDGQRPVESLEVGDHVLTLAPTGDKVTARITGLRSSFAIRHRRLSLAGGRTLAVTSRHPIATPSGWRLAGSLATGDVLRAENGVVRIADVTEVLEPVRVFDLTIDPHESFLVGGVLVHNKSLRVPKNESSAIGALREMASAQAAYASRNEGYFDVIPCLVEPRNCLPAYPKDAPGFLDPKFLREPRLGYRFELVSGPPAQSRTTEASPSSIQSFAYLAMPSHPRVTGIRSFCVDAKGVLCYTPEGTRPPVRDGGCVATEAPTGFKAWFGREDGSQACYWLR